MEENLDDLLDDILGENETPHTTNVIFLPYLTKFTKGKSNTLQDSNGFLENKKDNYEDFEIGDDQFEEYFFQEEKEAVPKQKPTLNGYGKENK